jgi:hypothetical protein
LGGDTVLGDAALGVPVGLGGKGGAVEGKLASAEIFDVKTEEGHVVPFWWAMRAGDGGLELGPPTLGVRTGPVEKVEGIGGMRVWAVAL